MKRYLYPIVVFLLLALCIGQFVSQYVHSKSKESEVYQFVRNRLEGAHDVLLNAPGEPLVGTYGQIREASGLIISIDKDRMSTNMNVVRRLNQEIEGEFFTLMLQNKFNEDRAFFVEQIVIALKVLPMKATEIDSRKVEKQVAQLHSDFMKYMSKKYNYYK